jgi:Domain of unknown function (DUF4202)
MTDLVQAAIVEFNALNAQDPNLIEDGEHSRPRELVQAERLEAWVLRLEPEADSALRLAARCQHIRRWTVPRSDYPEGRIEYLKWRKDLSRMHADTATEVLTRLGADPGLIAQVRTINLKAELKTNPYSQTMEDALCLAFLEHEFALFAEKHEDAKVIDIVQKTWRKMSERGHQFALTLPLSGRAQELVGRALAG